MSAKSILTITKRKESKINGVDFNNLSFGSVFTDHMFVCEYTDGQWQTPEIIPYGPLTMDPSAKVFHYGQAIFEGMKAFKDDAGKTWLFRPEDNHSRINKSAVRMAIPEFPKDYFFEGLQALLKIDNEWIKSGDGNSMYIRPFVIATENGVTAAPSKKYKFIIILAPAQKYYSGDVCVTIAEKFSRAADGGVGYAKAAGNYAAQFYPTNLAKEEGYQQIIWTDANNHEHLEEAGTMNIFFRVGDTLITAPTNDRILDGITRKSIIKLAQHNNITVEVRPVTVTEINKAAQEGTLLEVFGAGTAAVIVPFIGIGKNGDNYNLPKLDNSYASKFKKMLNDIQYNRTEDPFNWRFEVK